MFAMLLALLGCGDEAAEVAATPAGARTTTSWHTLGTWSGRGDRQTESFDITTGAMRVTWRTAADEATPGTGTFRVTLHSAISGRPLETIVEAEGSDSDTVRIAAEPRVAHLRIDADRVDWTLTLEEGVSVPAD